MKLPKLSEKMHFCFDSKTCFKYEERVGYKHEVSDLSKHVINTLCKMQVITDTIIASARISPQLVREITSLKDKISTRNVTTVDYLENYKFRSAFQRSDQLLQLIVSLSETDRSN